MFSNELTLSLTEVLGRDKVIEKQTFHPNVVVDVENKRVNIYLEDVSYYSSWIKGEDSDISLLFAMDDGRVVGAILPLRDWKGEFPISKI